MHLPHRLDQFSFSFPDKQKDCSAKSFGQSLFPQGGGSNEEGRKDTFKTNIRERTRLWELKRCEAWPGVE